MSEAWHLVEHEAVWDLVDVIDGQWLYGCLYRGCDETVTVPSAAKPLPQAHLLARAGMEVREVSPARVRAAVDRAARRTEDLIGVPPPPAVERPEGWALQVRGWCPMGCGKTLFLGHGGFVTCSWIECPDPGAASDLLQRSPEPLRPARPDPGLPEKAGVDPPPWSPPSPKIGDPNEWWRTGPVLRWWRRRRAG